MKSKLLVDSNGECTFALIFDTGDEVVAGPQNFAKSSRIASAYFTAIGALRDVTLGYFEIDRKEYHHIPIREQVEVLSLVGNVALDQDKPKIHAHLVVGKRDGTAHGGPSARRSRAPNAGSRPDRNAQAFTAQKTTNKPVWL